MSDFKTDKQAADTAAQKEANLATYKAWLAKNLKVRDCVANTKMFESYMDFTDELVATDFDFALGNLESSLVIQDPATPEELKAKLVAKIIELTSKDGISQGTTFKLDLEGGKRVAHWSIPQLATWGIPELTELLDELVRKRTLATKSASELQQTVESGRRYVGYPQLGKTVVRPGTVRAVPLDSAYLRGLDVWELKKYTRLYGVEQINNRLAGKD